MISSCRPGGARCKPFSFTCSSLCIIMVLACSSPGPSMTRIMLYPESFVSWSMTTVAPVWTFIFLMFSPPFPMKKPTFDCSICISHPTGPSFPNPPFSIAAPFLSASRVSIKAFAVATLTSLPLTRTVLYPKSFVLWSILMVAALLTSKLLSVSPPFPIKKPIMFWLT